MVKAITNPMNLCIFINKAGGTYQNIFAYKIIDNISTTKYSEVNINFSSPYDTINISIGATYNTFDIVQQAGIILLYNFLILFLCF